MTSTPPEPLCIACGGPLPPVEFSHGGNQFCGLYCAADPKFDSAPLARWVPSARLSRMKTNMIEKAKLYTVRCAKAWDGDGFGNEWNCGAAVYRSESDGDFYGQTKTLYRVFEDDGEGNGSHLDSFDNYPDARIYADLYAAFLDAGGFSNTPEAQAMAAFSQKHSAYRLTDA